MSQSEAFEDEKKSWDGLDVQETRLYTTITRGLVNIY